MSVDPLFPDCRPYRIRHLDVDPPHRLHLEECGHPKGLPVVFLHGGPGGGCEPWHRRFFDPDRYRVILFDQRGCGRSTPHACLESNTTWDLVADMERIREHLGIDRWVLFGGSWGSTLALAYAQTHPERVLGMVLRGIFLCRDEDIRWFYQEGAGRLFPDHWADYLAPIPEAERSDLVTAYYQRLTGADEVARMAAAKAWSEWEGRTATLTPNPAVVSHFQDPFTALGLARIECHYFHHGAFLEPGQLLRDAGRLRDIPCHIIHGRYDVVCPVDQAWALHQVWPEAELTIIPTAGHAASEPGIAQALVAATQTLADRLA
ncbi:proline iminopeptidase [Ectothiorhodospira magna]|uniref:Proline iminopeptidase n=1 Tax=Ectothiorhodospira magna TaxID=867345 RepID=A0A1H9D3R2_9GAMM|nr:prolyl aminopeptidase [Ectothiorhodospira magna]SEQ07987.1 proline iminopeptidase [Ectothiorhodospira magna]